LFTTDVGRAFAFGTSHGLGKPVDTPPAPRPSSAKGRFGGACAKRQRRRDPRYDRFVTPGNPVVLASLPGLVGLGAPHFEPRPLTRNCGSSTQRGSPARAGFALPAVFGTIPRSAAVVVARARWRRWARPWLVVVAAAASAASASGNLALPNKSGSLKFAVVGDFGTGDPPSYETAAQMAAARSRFPFDMVLMVGDNIVGRQSDPSDFVGKFEQPFGPLLKSGVRFYGALGNHDKSANRFYPAWNMGGQRYYTFVRQDVLLRAR
jgi:hypothetical protein